MSVLQSCDRLLRDWRGERSSPSKCFREKRHTVSKPSGSNHTSVKMEAPAGTEQLKPHKRLLDKT